MKPVAEFHLYQHIIIIWFRRDRIALLLVTLRDRPDLARLVLSFEGYLVPREISNQSRQGSGWFTPSALWRQNGRTISGRVVQDFGGLLAKALGNMTNLRSLYIYDMWIDMPSRTTQLLRNAAPRLSLTYLQIGPPFNDTGGTPASPAAPIASEILLFLRQQPLLERLTLPGRHESLAGQRLLPSDIPSLRSLDGVASDVMKIVPGRPVTSLNVCETINEPTTELWAKLDASTKPITRVTLHVNRGDQLDGNLKGMVKHLTHLRSLTLIGVREDVDHEVILTNVRLFGNLRNLTIYPIGSPKFDAWDVSCPNLEQVSIIRSTVYYPCYVSHNYCIGTSIVTGEQIVAHDH
ncbi:hypothetical protein FRB95_000525 [Tulasnella sp. JGI-2019a]|nr:hypothetical protein FRB95_000525 [Tulasnella sp. JGI-2019a]